MVKVLRWICNDCEKRWIYPVDKCVYCGKDTEKQVGTKTKIIGVSKVSLPSPQHSVVPYNVLLLEDEHGNRMPKKTIKDYEIGNMYEDAPSKDPHAVSIVKIKYDFFEAVKEALELIGDIKVDSDTKILIKPHIVAKAYPYMAMNTNPKVIEALIKVLASKGAVPENITVAENNHYVEMEAALPRSGIGKVCEVNKVNFVDLSKTEYEKVKAEDTEFEVSKEFLDKDLVINLPVMKTNSLLVITGALENLTRAVSKDDFEELKESPMQALQSMAILPKALPRMIHLGDASIGMQGSAPMDGEPAFLNMIMASKDPVALDKVFQELGMLNPADHVEMASKFDAGTSDISKIQIVGNELDAVKRELKPARRQRKR